MPAPVCRSTRRRHHTTSSRRRSGSSRRSTLRGRGRMKCRSWHRWRPRLDTRGRGDVGSARICRSWRRWALSNERAGRRISLCSSGASALLPPGSPSPFPLGLTSPESQPDLHARPWPAGDAQQVPLTALSRDELSAGTPGITLVADDVPLAIVAAPDYTAWWPLTAGRHHVPAPSRRGRIGSRVESEPVTVWVE